MSSETEQESWVDTHSVTCVFCGDLADERETANITTDISEIGPAMAHENPDRLDAIIRAAKEYGEGEAHENCLKTYQRQRQQ